VIEIVAALVAGAIVGAIIVCLPDLIGDALRVARPRRAERAVVRDAESLLRGFPA
jgi:hypothetical protein